MGRIVAQRLTETLGQQTVVDNRAGASGIIGHEIAMNAVPDGYTVLVSTSSGLVLNPLLMKVPYDPHRDFTLISLLVMSSQMLVSYVGLPARNIDELVALARARPGQLNCASPGFGTSNHLGCEMIKAMTSVNFLHVPYKGTAPAITDAPFAQRIIDQGQEPQSSTPAELSTHMRAEFVRWSDVIKRAGLKLER